MEYMTELAVVLIMPVGVVVGNATARYIAGVAQSGPADVVLALVIFDFGVLLKPEEFQGFMRPTFLPYTTLIYASLLVVGMIFWGISVFGIERRIDEFREYRSISSRCTYVRCGGMKRANKKVPALAYLGSLVVPTVFMSWSLIPFFAP